MDPDGATDLDASPALELSVGRAVSPTGDRFVGIGAIPDRHAPPRIEAVPVRTSPSQAADPLDYTALAVTGALVALIATRGAVPVKELFLLIFISYVPGRAVTTHWTSLKGATLAVTTLMGSLALTTLLATVILWLHWWHPATLFAGEVAASATSLVFGLTHRYLARPQSRRLAMNHHPATAQQRGRHLTMNGHQDAVNPRGRHLTANGHQDAVNPRGRHLTAHGRPAAAKRRHRHLVPDALVVCGLVLWGMGISDVQLGRIGQWGLLPALSVTFYAGVTLVVVSIIWLMGSRKLSGLRLVLDLTALVIMIAGTPALVYAAPRYAWLYKHIGVVQFINLHGAVNQTIDIYQNWPGFFALVAWFDRVVGSNSPLRFAAWTEVVMVLVSCAAIDLAARRLHLNARERWIGLFVFVVASWTDGFYFSPQALAYAMSLGVLALVVTSCQTEHSGRWLRWTERRVEFVVRRSRRPDVPSEQTRVGPSPVGSLTKGPRAAAIVAILGIYGVIVFVHPLSPYVVALQITALTIFGRVRPKWLALSMWIIPIGYLIPRFSYINRTYGLLNSLGTFLSNVQTQSTAAHRPYAIGVRYVSHISVAITVIVCVLTVIGVVRRFRAGRPTLTLSILAFSPILTFFITSYGQQVAYRVYYFSLPWLALLAASAISPAASRSGLRAPSGHRVRSVLPFGIVLLVLTALLIPAYFGDDEIYVVPTSEITVAEYFYNHAPPGSALIPVAGGLPLSLSARYDQYLLFSNQYDPDLLYYPPFSKYTKLGTQSLPALSEVAQTFIRGGHANVYIVFTKSGLAGARAYNLTMPGALEDLEAAMVHSPQWSTYFKNTTTRIFLFHPEGPAPS